MSSFHIDGARLKAERERLGLSRRALAAKLGFFATEHKVLAWERGHTRMTPVRLKQLVGFGYDTFFLVSGARYGAIEPLSQLEDGQMPVDDAAAVALRSVLSLIQRERRTSLLYDMIEEVRRA